MTAPRKPRDVGNGLVCASFGSGGQWLSLATVHPEAGFVELTGLPLFAPEWRGDPDAVRRYRSWMRRDEHAFLLLDAGRATVTTRQDAPRGTRGVVQRIVIKASHRTRPAGIRIRLNGRLAPPVLAEITEVNPPAEEGQKSRLKVREGTLRVNGEGGPIIVQAWLRKGGESPWLCRTALRHAHRLEGAAPQDAHGRGLDRLARRGRGGAPRHRLHLRHTARRAARMVRPQPPAAAGTQR